MSLAEKFQVTVPYKDEGKPDEKWASFKSQRRTEANTTPEEDSKFNHIPTTDICGNGCIAEFNHGFGGNLDESGPRLFKGKQFTDGFTRLDMKSTDDQYGGEHIDLFYGDAVDEKGDIGFTERNNYLDRI